MSAALSTLYSPMLSLLSSLKLFIIQDIPDIGALIRRAIFSARLPDSIFDSRWVYFLPVATGVLLTSASALYCLLHVLHVVLWRRGTPTPVPVHLSTSSSAARECTPTASPAERPASLHHLHHHHNCHFLTRLVLLRGMGVLYTAAFLTSAFQSRALFGTSGHLVHHACCLLSSLHHIG